MAVIAVPLLISFNVVYVIYSINWSSDLTSIACDSGSAHNANTKMLKGDMLWHKQYSKCFSNIIIWITVFYTSLYETYFMSVKLEERSLRTILWINSSPLRRAIIL